MFPPGDYILVCCRTANTYACGRITKMENAAGGIVAKLVADTGSANTPLVAVMAVVGVLSGECSLVDIGCCERNDAITTRRARGGIENVNRTGVVVVRELTTTNIRKTGYNDDGIPPTTYPHRLPPTNAHTS